MSIGKGEISNDRLCSAHTIQSTIQYNMHATAQGSKPRAFVAEAKYAVLTPHRIASHRIIAWYTSPRHIFPVLTYYEWEYLARRWLWWHVVRGHGRERQDREHPVWSMREWSRASTQYLAAYCPLIYWSEAPSRFPLPIFNYSDITCWHELFSKLFIISRFKFILFQWNELCRFNLGPTVNSLEYSNELYVSHLFLLIANDIWRARESTSIVVT